MSMKIFFALLAFTGASFSVAADPSDYPPTAFQLAQILHYVQHETLVKKGVMPCTDKMIAEAEAMIASHINNPLQADENSWADFLDVLIAEIQSKRNLPFGLLESLTIKGAREVIVKAIMAEQDAQKKDHVILWRAATDSPENQPKDSELSFSLGLFSGFLFDGYSYHGFGVLTGIGPACTYMYLSEYLDVARLIDESKAGRIYQKYRGLFPAFFAEDAYGQTLPAQYDDKLSHATVLQRIERFYYDKNGKSPDGMGALFNERRKFENPLQPFYLFGVVMPKDEVAARLTASKADAVNNVFKNKTQQRGEFLNAERAVYGKGELFHPKEKMPEGAEIVKLFDRQ